MTNPIDPVDDGATGGREPSSGRFAPGNRFSRGNPYAKRVAELRSALFDAVGTEELKAIIGALVERAKGGDVPAAREVLERTLGKSEATDVLARVEALEEALEAAHAAKEKRWT